MPHLAAVSDLDAGRCIGALDGAQRGASNLRLAQEFCDGRTDISANCLVGFVTFVGRDACLRDKNSLGRGAHLPRIK